MSGSHDSHHSTEQKPVAFTVPLILASVLVLIIVLFLSLCDPKPHHHEAAGHGDSHATEASHGHDAASSEHHEAAPAVIVVQSHADTAKTNTTTDATHEEVHH
jgi:hypothetical protein